MDSLTNVVRVAKKIHICNLCGSKIEVGEPYHYHAFVVDREFCVTKEHVECHEAGNIVMDEYCDPYDEVSFSDIQEGLVEMSREIMGDVTGVPLRYLAKRLYEWDQAKSILSAQLE